MLLNIGTDGNFKSADKSFANICNFFINYKKILLGINHVSSTNQMIDSQKATPVLFFAAPFNLSNGELENFIVIQFPSFYFYLFFFENQIIK